MFFSLLLWLMVWRIKFRLFLLSIFNKQLFAEIRELKLAIQVQSKDQQVVRTLILNGGKLQTGRQPLNEEQKALQHLIVTFADAHEAPTIIKTLSKNKEQIFNFIQNQEIQIEGEMAVLQSLFALREKMSQ